MTAKFFIWSLFLLIVDQTLVIMGFKFGLPLRPSFAYAGIALGLLVSALMLGGGMRQVAAAKWFFLPFLALVILIAVTYRGENPRPEFNHLILRAHFIPSSASYVVWPALNLIACAALFVLAGSRETNRTIVLAAFAALIVQVSAMEADMWWFSLFGDPNGRAGGLAQNANVAALLVTVLATITLRDPRISSYAVILAIAGALLSQSKSGILAAAVLFACFIAAYRWRPMNWSVPAFATVIIAILAGTIFLSPVLNPTPEQIAQREKATTAAQLEQQQTPVATLDVPVTLEERMKSRVAIDESAGLRWGALKFYFGVLRETPSAILVGMGTGFTNKFITGPHNSFLKLAVDNGVIAAILLAVLLARVSWKAAKSRSPQMVCLALISWISALFYHTFMVDPIVLPALAIALALSNAPRPDDAISRRGACSEYAKSN